MPSCSVNGCKNRNENTKNKGIKYFRISKDSEISLKWIEFCSNEKLNLQTARVCSIHFADDCFERKPGHLIVPGDTDILRWSKHAIPTLNLIVNNDNLRNKRKILADVTQTCTNTHKKLKVDSLNSKENEVLAEKSASYEDIQYDIVQG